MHSVTIVGKRCQPRVTNLLNQVKFSLCVNCFRMNNNPVYFIYCLKGKITNYLLTYLPQLYIHPHLHTNHKTSLAAAD